MAATHVLPEHGRTRSDNRTEEHNAMFRGRTLVLAATAALLLAACGNNASNNSSPDSTEAVTLGDSATINVDDDGFSGNFFDPARAVVRSGTTVTWTWVGNREHNVVGDGFQSDVMSSGSFSHTFDEPGVYRYTCTLHGNMDGVVEVID
jgi:plastocyanin